MKKTIAIAALILVACGPTNTPAIAVASLGIAGAGLATYCAAQGAGCSSALVTYSSSIISEATADAAILESGQTTTAQIGQIIMNLNIDISLGRALPGLTAAQQTEVSAILSTASAVITLVGALVPAASVTAQAVPVKIPALRPTETAKISQMRANVAAVKR